MDLAGLDALVDAIRHMHGREPTWVESVPDTETFNGETVWNGGVQVSDVNHPKTGRAYAWSYETDGGRRFVAVLRLGPVTDAITAVRASIAARGKI